MRPRRHAPPPGVAEIGRGTRDRNLDRLATERFDLCVVGGGITGAGVALEAAARGLKVALIEGGDLASGTSSRSTKLIHGGLRYLTHGEVGLCREATRERAALAALCPHLVRPLPILYPVMKGGRSPLTVGGGLAAYNLIGGKRRFPVAARVGPEQIEIFAPSLRAERLRAAWSFWEASTDDARLVITVIREAHLRGAVVANHVRALGFESIGGRLAAVVAVDEASGSAVTISLILASARSMSVPPPGVRTSSAP